MKINISIDLSEVFGDDCSVEELVRDAIKFDVERQLRKSPEYNKFIEGATSRAINRILEAE